MVAFVGGGRSKLHWQALAKHVREHLYALLRERASHFGVSVNAIHGILSKMKIMHKKALRYRERDREKRITYLQKLRAVMKEPSRLSIIYIDESGFSLSTGRIHGCAYKGKKVHGDVSGCKRPRTSLIAPMLFKGCANTAL